MGSVPGACGRICWRELVEPFRNVLRLYLKTIDSCMPQEADGIAKQVLLTSS